VINIIVVRLNFYRRQLRVAWGWASPEVRLRVTDPNALSTLATIVAEFGDSATVAVFGHSRRILRQSPFSATVAE